MSTHPERSARQSKTPADAVQSDLLVQYGITSVPATFYEWAGYRYTNAYDAIAAAKRGTSE